MNESTRGVNLIVYRILIYSALLFWAFLCLFPIYWTITTSFKTAVSVTQGHLIPWFDFTPKWIGFRSLGLSPETIFQISTVRDEFLRRFFNSVITSISASTLAVMLGSLAAYGLSRFEYKLGFVENTDISFFFLVSDDSSSSSPRIAVSGPIS